MSSAESWEIAKNYASLLGSVPSSFSAAVRTLINEQEKGGGELSPTSKATATRLFQGPSSKLAMERATRLFRAREVNDPAAVSARDLVSLYRAGELAALIGGLYLFRRGRKRVGGEVWEENLGPQMQKMFDAGFFVGTALPNVGAGAGALVCSLRYVALGTYHIHDAKGFKEYLRFLEKKRARWDEAWENDRWGCASSQVASVLVQLVGFGATLSNQIYGALSLPEVHLEVEDPVLYRLKIAQAWAAALLETGKEPDIVHRGEYYPLKDALTTMTAQFAELGRRSGPGWLSPPEATPEETPEEIDEIEEIE